MIHRVVLAIAGVTALAVIGFGIPLGAAIEQLYAKEALLRLEREATAATIEVPKTFGGEPVELPRAAKGSILALYLPSGQKVAGRGPTRGDAVVRKARKGQVVDARHRGSVVVAVPVTSSEHVIAVMRASRAASEIEGRARRAWGAMGVLGAVVVGLAALGAFLLARRLTRPVTAFADAVTRLGDGDFSGCTGRSGIGELDLAAEALDSTAERLGGLLERERAFSADASHQLRTPVTALRVHLEAADLETDGAARRAIDDALVDVERLERTIVDLLLVGRDIPTSRSQLDLETLFGELDHAWRGQLATEGRSLTVSLPAGLDPVWASTSAVRQILYVLMSNAAGHGARAVTVAAHNIAGGVAIEISDEGPGFALDPEAIFTRRDSAEQGHGIGLSLARSLAEAEGGRLLLRPDRSSATFALLFSTPEDRSSSS